MLVAFELQTLQRGRWEIDSVYDSRDAAISEALRLGASERYAAVRVVEEKYDEASASGSTKTVFKVSREEREGRRERQRWWQSEAELERYLDESRSRRLAKRAAAGAAQGRFRILRPIAAFTLGACALLIVTIVAVRLAARGGLPPF
jgi:hypothetical protein